MAFLTPFFLLGLGAVAIPILIHLQRRNRARVEVFPSLFFLRRMELASVRRRWIRNWVLLALRCAAIALLVLAFARPWLPSAALGADVAEVGRDHVLVVDRSYSMGFGDRWQVAKSALRRAVEGLGAGDRAALIAFSDRAAVLVEPTTDRELLEAAIDALALEPRPTRLAPGLRLARRMLLESEPGRRALLLVSDLQRLGTRDEALVALPEGTEVEIVDPGRTVSAEEAPANLLVASTAFDHRVQGDRERVLVQARVARRGGAEDLGAATVALELDGRVLETRPLVLGDDGTARVDFDEFTLPEGASRGAVRLSGDRLEIDNVSSFVLRKGEAMEVVLVESPRVGTPSSGFYVSRALSLSQRPRYRVRPVRAAALSAALLETADLVVVSDASLSGAAAEALRGWVEGGGGLFVALGSTTDVGNLARLSAAGLIPAVEGGAVGGGSTPAAKIGFFDRAAPGYEIFAAPGSGDFGAARFFRRHRLAAPAEGDRVVARFDDGRPAFLERRLGSGRVLVLASTLDRYWNDLPLKPVFVPFLHQSMARLARIAQAPPSLLVGQVVDTAALADPDHGGAPIERIESPSGERLEPQDLVEVSELGFYRFELENGDERLVAVNPDPAEGDLAADDLEQVLATLRPSATEADATADADELGPSGTEGLQGLWRYLIVGLLGLLLAESVVARRTVRGA